METCAPQIVAIFLTKGYSFVTSKCQSPRASEVAQYIKVFAIPACINLQYPCKMESVKSLHSTKLSFDPYMCSVACMPMYTHTNAHKIIMRMIIIIILIFN